jgi:hypothetical protein
MTASVSPRRLVQLIANIGPTLTARDQEISVVVGLAGIAAEGPSQLPKTSSGVKSGLMPADKGTMSANRAIVRSIADLLNHSAGRHALIFAVI